MPRYLYHHQSLLIFLVGLLLLTHAQYVKRPHFFLTNKQRCNCRGDKQCDKLDGSCSPDTCSAPYFGINCQHANINFTGSLAVTNVPSELTDGDDKTCLPNFNGNATFQLNHFAQFIWVYVCRKYRKAMTPNLALYENNNLLKTTGSVFFMEINDNSLLIKLRKRIPYNRLELTLLPHDTCSVEVSMGRNLAISSEPIIIPFGGSETKQNTKKAIDGDELYSCSVLTISSDTSNWWVVKLPHRSQINQISILSDVAGKCGNWTFQFRITRDDLYVSVLKQTPSTTSELTKIPVPPRRIHNSTEVKFVLQRATPNTCAKSPSIKVCEVFIYGEYDCPDTYYGPSCETHSPEGATRELCDPDWGCPVECKQNWWGPGLIFCAESCVFRWGPKCDYPCPAECAGLGECNTKTGECLDGCKSGFAPPNCEPCPPGQFDINCAKTCTHCKKNLTTNQYACVGGTGECLLGCAADSGGDNCEQIVVVEDPLSKLSSYHWIAIVLVLLLLLYKSMTLGREEEESTFEEEVAAGQVSPAAAAPEEEQPPPPPPEEIVVQEESVPKKEEPVHPPPKQVKQPPKQVEHPPKPVEHPSKPVQQPPKPVEQPPKPVEQPPKPVEQPPKPVEQPPKPVEQPPKPVEQPPKPVEQPPKPVEQPPKPIEQPPKPVEQPPKPVEQPQKPVEQPPKPIEQPPKPVEQPPKPVQQPPKPVEQPPKPVEQPPKPVQQPPKPVKQPPLESSSVDEEVESNPTDDKTSISESSEGQSSESSAEVVIIRPVLLSIGDIMSTTTRGALDALRRKY